MARRRFPVRALVLVVVIIIAVAAGLWWYRTFEGDPYVTHAKYQGMLDDVAKDFGANALVTQLSLEKHGGDVTALTDGRRVQAGTSYGVGGNKTEIFGHHIAKSEVVAGARRQPALTLARLRRLDPAAEAQKLLGAKPEDVTDFRITNGTHGWKAEVSATVGGVARNREERLPR